MTESRIEKQFNNGSAFAVPTWIIDEHKKAVFKTIGEELQPQTVHFQGYDIDAYYFPGKIGEQETRRQLFGQADNSILLVGLIGCTFHEATLDEEKIILILPQYGKVDMVDADSILENKEKTLAVGSVYLGYLERFSQLTGWRIVYHYHSPKPCTPYKDEPNTLHLLPGTFVLGEDEVQWKQKVFGIYIRENTQHVQTTTGTKGRGIILYDPEEPSEKNTIVQLLGNNAYILFPIVTHYYGLKSDDIFQHALALIWNTLRQREKGELHPLEETEGEGAWTYALKRYEDELPNYYKKREEEIQVETEEIRKTLERRYRDLHDLRRIRSGLMQSKTTEETKDRIAKDWERLQKNPWVKRLFVCDEGIHVETNLISLEHEGEKYSIGRFMIRIGARGKLNLWPIETRHPLGIPHPHMPLHGTPCFGTATTAIAQASGELRIADAMELVIRWLNSGYTEESADHRITEWIDPKEVDEKLKKGLAAIKKVTDTLVEGQKTMEGETS